MPSADIGTHVAATLTMIKLGCGSQETLRRAKFLADARVELGWALRAAARERQEASQPWAAADAAAGLRREAVSRYPADGPIIYLGESHGGGEVSQARTDAHAATAVAMIQMAADSQDPLRRAKILADAQMQLGWTLRAAVEECQQAGKTWAAIGEAIGLPRETAFRQWRSDGPIITAKPVQSKTSPGVTQMHRPADEAVYAFRSQAGRWFGPSDALPEGQFTDGVLHFEPAEPVSPFAGQLLTMRYGPWDQDVSVHACQVLEPGGQQRRVRVTHAVLDFLFGDGQTPLRQAMTALVHATGMNPRVRPQLRAAIEQAASAMVPGVPLKQFIASVEAVVSLAPLAVADEHVMVAMRRLERVVTEYRAWAAAASR